MGKETIEQFLNKVLGPQAMRLSEPMSLHTTFRVGGPADYYVAPSSIDQVIAVAEYCRAENIQMYVMGCGSNLLVADAGLRGVVMKIGSQLSDISLSEEGRISAQAGATNAKIARLALDNALGGFEFAAGIPGSIGGAAIMNAGAYGGELRDVAVGVLCLTAQGEVRTCSPEDAGWGYRASKLAERGDIVLSVDLQLSNDDPVAIKGRMVELARRRSDKQPLDLPSAGSTFKRPEGYYAGKLIQDAGMQGYTVGGAQVSNKHAGFVVNTGQASAADIMKVIEDVREAVLKQFGVELVPEVRRWGFSSSADC